VASTRPTGVDQPHDVPGGRVQRTVGSDLIDRGARLEVVSRLLGHASTTVTERAYAELLEATIAREVLALVD
jgi:integrase